jgi:ABC-2 type transport system permease protein
VNGLSSLPKLSEKDPINQLFKRWFIELGILFRIQLSIIRQQWVIVFVISALFPLTTLMFMKFFAVDPSSDAIIRIISGNMIFGLVVMGLNSMGQEISWQKHQGHFTFYASLPISKVNFILANLMKGFLTALPSFIVLAIIGQLVFGVQFHYSMGLLPVMILTIFSVVGLGVCIGFWSPNQQLTNLLVQVLMMVISFMTPVMVEKSQLPILLQIVSYIFPTTYATSALREMLTIGWTETVTVNMGILATYTIVTYVIINRFVSWRVEG